MRIINKYVSYLVFCVFGWLIYKYIILIIVFCIENGFVNVKIFMGFCFEFKCVFLIKNKCI